ncbi:short-chain dehydrogenase [Protofrankia sp. BMG5.30]|uniref:Short-chain dehydrogenase n=1 Tax=Protofrankia coriariae TaxID=1562887 RepID=A0ABR5EYV9_9ACTN|nr:short-chain dehydrogenase [Protofrankia coriariae]ONH33728.1 short-chain dehydrogenase [Protofrankia sp. BMG5.30]
MTASESGGSALLEGRTVLITGAGSGIGRTTAHLAAEAGALVIAIDLKGQDETAAAITEAGGRAEARALDVSDAAAWQILVDGVIESHGSIHGLASIAGIVSDVDSLLSQTEEGWDRILAVDLKGVWLGARAVVPALLENGGGKIVNIASTAGLIGMQNVLAYSAAKGGVIALSRQVAVEYAARNIQINVIAPGVTQTPMLGDITEELLTTVTAATPSGRLGRPEDVGNLVVYLLSPKSDFITGQVIPVDGGWTAQ